MNNRAGPYPASYVCLHKQLPPISLSFILFLNTVRRRRWRLLAPTHLLILSLSVVCVSLTLSLVLVPLVCFGLGIPFHFHSILCVCVSDRFFLLVRFTTLVQTPHTSTVSCRVATERNCLVDIFSSLLFRSVVLAFFSDSSLFSFPFSFFSFLHSFLVRVENDSGRTTDLSLVYITVSFRLSLSLSSTKPNTNTNANTHSNNNTHSRIQ